MYYQRAGCNEGYESNPCPLILQLFAAATLFNDHQTNTRNDPQKN